jgi:hypothetical protein
MRFMLNCDCILVVDLAFSFFVNQLMVRSVFHPTVGAYIAFP